MTRYAQLELERQLCFPLYAASRAVTRAYAPLLEPFELTYPQYLTMLALWADDGATVGALGRTLHLDSGTLTPLLKRLEVAGLVTRRRDHHDERRVVVSLTTEGDRLQEQVEHVPLAVAARLGLDPDEGAVLHGLLHRVLQTLDAEPLDGHRRERETHDA